MTGICINIRSAALLASNLLVMTAGPAIAWGADIVLAPKTNQVGYLPDAEKGFTIVAGGTVTGGSPFQVRTSADMLAYSGQLEPNTVNETAAAGEVVLRGDFSPLATPGTYVVVAGGLVSRPFVIGAGVYGRLYRDAARAFDIIRSGVAINDPITGVTHPPSHTMDAALRDRPGMSRNMTGGWYNAGDYGKWVHMAAISASYMMWLHELAGTLIDSVPLQIPDTVAGVPDLLTEARWGLSWLLKMQNTDGSVYHKVDTEPSFAWGLAPEMDPYPRSAAAPSSIDAGDFVAVMLQAARVFSSSDATFAATCRAAADLSWTWLEANPNVPQPDPYYTDADPSQEVLWALAERVRATHDSALTSRLSARLASTTLGPLSWQAPHILGYLSSAVDSAGSPAVRTAARAAITGLGDALLARSAANGYGVALLSSEYVWGSVENVINRADALLFAHALTSDARYRDGALRQLDWVLGRNSLDRSFVTAYGQNSSVNPYHWTRYVYSKLVPGWTVGGPNPNSPGVDPPLLALQQLGTPAAKCYLDLCAANGSWASNEGQTSENAALLFAAGMLSDGTTGTAVPGPTTPSPTIGAGNPDGGVPDGGGSSSTGTGGSGASTGTGGSGVSTSTGGSGVSTGTGGTGASTSTGTGGTTAPTGTGGTSSTGTGGRGSPGINSAASSGCGCGVGSVPSPAGWLGLFATVGAILAGRRRKSRLPSVVIATATVVMGGVAGFDCSRRSGSPGSTVPTEPLIVSTATRKPITTTRSVSYWDWMPSYGNSVAGTETLVAALKPAIIRVGGYNNDVNMADPFGDAAFDAAVAYARAIGAEPLIQAPLLRDNNGQPPTPATAAAMVTYANVTKGYRIKYFSVGNEPDLYPDIGMPGNAALPAMPGLTPSAYCTLVRPFVAAMRAADPTIQIVGPDLSYKYQVGNGSFDWLTPILTNCGDLYDIVSIHRYPFEAKQATLAAAAADIATFKSVITSVRGILASTGQSAKPLALTETNVVYNPTGCVLAGSPGTVGSALWMASTVGATIDLGLWTGAVWDISDTDDYSLGLIGLPPAHTPRPAYHAYRLFADHFGSTHLDVTKAPSGVTAYASRNPADDTTQIIAVNWNQSPAGLEVQVTGLPNTPPSATFVLPPVSFAAIEVPDGRPAMAWTYGEAQRQTASGPVPLPPGATTSAAGGDGGTSTAGGAGKVPGTSCATDGGVVCTKLVPPSPAITTMGAMIGTGVSFGSGVETWSSYSYAGAGEIPPTATVTPDGTGLEIMGGFSPAVTAASNFAGFGLYLASSSCLDASGYTGIAFDFSGSLGGCNLQAGINFSGNDSTTNDPSRGACSGTTSQCYGPSADVTSTALAATASSPTIRVPFASFGGGMPNPTADPSTIVAVQWQLTAPLGSADGGGCAADFTVTNAAFYR